MKSMRKPFKNGLDFGVYKNQEVIINHREEERQYELPFECCYRLSLTDYRSLTT